MEEKSHTASSHQKFSLEGHCAFREHHTHTHTHTHGTLCIYFISLYNVNLLKETLFLFFLFLKTFFNVFYLFLRQRETEHEGGEGQREGDTESEAGSRL